MTETVKLGDEATADLPEGFEMTEFGPLPKDWRVVQLGEVIKVIRNGLTKRQNREANGIPVTRIETIAEEKINPNRVGFIDSLTHEEIERYRLLPGDILFSHINSEPQIGKSAIYEGIPPVLLHGMNLLLIRVDRKKCDPFFLNELFHYYRRVKVFMSIASRAVGQASINQGKMRNLPIPLPPLSEQRAIAYVLRTIHRAKETTEKIIAATREMKGSLMRHLFTYGPVPVEEAERVPLKETEIGLIRDHWEVVRLGDVTVRAFSGGTPSTKNTAFWSGPIPWITTAVIQEDDVELLRFQRTISEEALRKTATCIAPKGSLMVGTRVGVGKAVVATFDVAVNQDITVLVLDRRVNPYFIAYLLKDQRYKKWFDDNKRGTTIKGVPRQDVLNLLIPLPTLEEQQTIVGLLTAIERKIQAEEACRAALENFSETLLQLCMTGRVRVKDLPPSDTEGVS